MGAYTTKQTKTVEATKIVKVSEKNGITIITLEGDEDAPFALTNDQITDFGGDVESGDWYVKDGNNEYIESELVFDSIYKKVEANA